MTTNNDKDNRNLPVPVSLEKQAAGAGIGVVGGIVIAAVTPLGWILTVPLAAAYGWRVAVKGFGGANQEIVDGAKGIVSKVTGKGDQPKP